MRPGFTEHERVCDVCGGELQMVLEGPAVFKWECRYCKGGQNV